MSTETATRRSRTSRRRGRAFAGGFVAVVAVLAALTLVGAAASNAQGPRATAVQVDPAAAVAASGSRLIITTNQSLGKVPASHVKVTPAAAFTVDTEGRSVGLRFTLPLHDDTAYTVRISDVKGLGGGPATTITEGFRTPAMHAYLLQRTSSGDTIVRTDLAGTEPLPVFRNDHIEDFRATSSHLVMSVRTDDDKAMLIVTDLQGKHERDLPLPGDGDIRNLQSADRGELVGYTYSDADLSATTGRESALFTASLKDSEAKVKPTPVAVSGTEKRVSDWRFVPDTDSLVVLTYDGRLLLSGASGSNAADLGTGTTIDGIARGSSRAVIERADGLFTLDLTDGTQAPLVDATGVTGTLGTTTPMPGEKAGTVRPYSIVDAAGTGRGTTVYRVADDGAATSVLTIPGTDAVLQTCVSPSGRYVAVLVAPDVVANPYDGYELPMPAKVQTHIIDLTDDKRVSAITGFDISWCQVPPGG